MCSKPSSNKQWAHSLFQHPAMLSTSPPIKPPRATVPAARHIQSLASEQKPPGEDNASSSPKKVSVSRLAFPFNARRKMATATPTCPPGPPSPIPKRMIEPPVRQKHVFVPSPLARSVSSADDATAPTPSSAALFLGAKPHPRYHGYSRHSFMLTKWVWSTRQELREARPSSPGSDSREQASEPSSPLSSPPTSPPPLAHLKVPSTSHPSFHRLRRLRSFYVEEKRPEQSPLTMYPRQGDISALRNPHCARVDRAFASVSLYTLRKIACLYAMLMTRFEEAGSEASFGSGGESDTSTLVDSDTDRDWDSESSGATTRTCSSRQDYGDDIISTHVLSKGNLLSLAVRKATREIDVPTSTVHMASIAWLCSLYRRPDFGTLPKELVRRGWPSCWMELWELFIELSRRSIGELEVARVTKKEVTKVKPPKEFRWLKLLGTQKKPTAPTLPTSPAVRTAFLTSSHPAAG